MSRQLLDKWLPMALSVEQVRTSFTPPARVLLGEAVDLAKFVCDYWDPVKDAAGKVLRPGLSTAGVKVSANVGVEILELQEALQTAHTDYLLTVASKKPDVRARAEFVLGEIVAALEWWLDDGVEDDRDRQLAALKGEYSDGSASTDTIAAELADYAALARQEAEGLAGLGGFDIGLIDEAESLSKRLREMPTTPAAPEKVRRALDVRNRVATLLIDRMYLVRTAARFVFRNQPEIARQATSLYLRKGRAAARRAANNKPAPANDPTKPAVGE